jgi:hypothetical protein
LCALRRARRPVAVPVAIVGAAFVGKYQVGARAERIDKEK